jgi:glutamine amidotransferase
MSDLIAVIDYGMGNLHSVASALEHVGAGRVVVSSNPDDIREADRVVFPGVGAMRDCMAEIRRLGFDDLVAELITDRPVLAICVGMQALMNRSEENDGVDCLSLLPGEVRFFGETLTSAEGERLKVPHMGWNQVQQTIDHPLWSGIDQDARFYFVHSYYVHCEDRDLVAASTSYGCDIDAALARDYLFAVQFHPEKSHRAGLKLLSNFVNWRP